MPNENQNDRASFATFFLDHARGFGAQRSGAMSIAEAAASQAAKRFEQQHAANTAENSKDSDPTSRLTDEERALLEKHPELRKDFDTELAERTKDSRAAAERQSNIEHARSVHDARDALRSAARRIASERDK